MDYKSISEARLKEISRLKNQNRQLKESKEQIMSILSIIPVIDSQVNSDSPRNIQFLIELVSPYKESLISMPQGMKKFSMLVDTAIWYLQGDGWAGKLPFSYGEAYRALGIPKEFLD